MGKLSPREQLDANQRALDQLALLTGKPRVALHTPRPPRQKRAAAVNTTPKEHDEQVAVIKWWYWYSKTIGLDYRQLVAVPNAQPLFRFATNPHAFLGYLHAEGMRDGMLDLVLFHPRGEWHGCLIEMKRITGSVESDDQKEIAGILLRAGYQTNLCRGASHAIETIKSYCAA